jgi:hypothetical protein
MRVARVRVAELLDIEFPASVIASAGNFEIAYLCHFPSPNHPPIGRKGRMAYCTDKSSGVAKLFLRGPLTRCRAVRTVHSMEKDARFEIRISSAQKREVERIARSQKMSASELACAALAHWCFQAKEEAMFERLAAKSPKHRKVA